MNNSVQILTKNLINCFLDTVLELEEIKNEEEICSSFLLDLTTSAFIGAFFNVLNVIKEETKGEQIIFDNIELIKTTILKAIESLPFMKRIISHG